MKPLLIPCSIGEALDKLTILELKASKFKDDDPRSIAVDKERSAVYRALEETGFRLPCPHPCYRQLAKINAELWAVEDRIRIHLKQYAEKVKGASNEAEVGYRKKPRKVAYPKAFMDDAALVPKLNDQRAILKRELSVHYNSTLIEVKSYAGFELGEHGVNHEQRNDGN